MITVATERYRDGWRWLLSAANGQRVHTGSQVYLFEDRAHQMGQLQLDAARRDPLVGEL